MQIIAEKYMINKIIEEYINDINLFIQRKNKLYKLKELKLPEQRSPEWYDMRRDKLTASSFATALNEDHFSTRNQCLYDKITEEPHKPSIYTEWGTKYEEIATLFYQLITKTNVLEFGLIPHPDFPAFGASPDGICDDMDDCVGEYDECDVCNGDGIADGACDCEGNVDAGCGCGEAGPSGCDNECGSTATNDECGVCGGDNSSCADCEGNPNGGVVEDCAGECGG